MEYSDYEKMIQKLAHKHSQNEEEFMDMMGVGMEAFMKALNAHDPNKGKFSTILYRIASNSMVDEYRKGKKHRYHMSYEGMVEDSDTNSYVANILPADYSSNPERNAELADSLGQLGDEAKQILRVIFDSPNEVFEMSKSLAPKYLRGALTRLLRKKNFKWESIYTGVAEIRQVVSELE